MLKEAWMGMRKQPLLLVLVLVILLLQLQLLLLSHALGNAATATKATTAGSCTGNANTATTANSAKTCTGNSATASKLATARNIKLQGAVSGNANFDGSANITINTTQANIATLTGTFSTPAANSGTLTGSVDINYPADFKRDNCTVLGLMCHGSTKTDVWNTTQSPEYSTLSGNGDLKVCLMSNKIRISVTKADDAFAAQTITYKVTLMKI